MGKVKDKILGDAAEKTRQIEAEYLRKGESVLINRRLGPAVDHGQEGISFTLLDVLDGFDIFIKTHRIEAFSVIICHDHELGRDLAFTISKVQVVACAGIVLLNDLRRKAV